MSCTTPQSSINRCPAGRSTFLSAKRTAIRPFNAWMEILPSALCWCICKPSFMRIRTIRKSGYFASVLELRPLFRCRESSRRSCASSCSKSMFKRGSARRGNPFSSSLPWPGIQRLCSIVIVNPSCHLSTATASELGVSSDKAIISNAALLFG